MAKAESQATTLPSDPEITLGLSLVRDSDPRGNAVGTPPISTRLRRDFAPRVYAEIGTASASELHAGFSVALHLGWILATAVGCELLRARGASFWVVYPLAVMFVGTRFRALGNMLHESCHGMLVRGKRRNAFWGRLLAIIDFAQLDAYTHEHFTHHRYLGHAERDLDFVTRRKFGFGDPEPRFILKHYLRPLTLFHVPTFFKPVFFHRDDPWAVSVGRVAYLAALIGAALWLGWQPVLLYYVVPYLTAYQVIRYWSDAVDHAGAIGNVDEFHRSRNHLFSWELLNRIIFPRFDEYHLVHHLFPAVPVRLQGKVHRLLLEDPEYAARHHEISFTHREAAAPLFPAAASAK